MSSPSVSLGSLVRIRTGKLDANASSKEGKYPFFTCAIEPLRINSFSYDCECVLVAGNGDLNAKYYKGKFDAYQRTYIIESLDSAKLDTRYLFHFMDRYVAKLRQMSIGGVIKYIKLGYLTEAQIPLPPLPEQKRIAAILDKADAIRQKREKAIELTDSFLRSVFLEMFGDPVSNPKAWTTATLGEVAERFSDGPFGSNLKSCHYVPTGVRVVRLQNIGVSRFIDNDAAYISESHFEKLIKHKCVQGDVIIGTMGDPNLRACTLPAHIPIALNKADCVQLRPDTKVVVAEYLVHLLSSPRTLRLASSLLHGQTRTRISSGQLKTLRVPIPPLELQSRFATVVKVVEQLNQRFKTSTSVLADLNHSLHSTLLTRSERHEKKFFETLEAHAL